MSHFFVLITYCGIVSCNPPVIRDFPDASSCQIFVEAWKNHSGAYVTCFDQATGKIIASNKGRK